MILAFPKRKEPGINGNISDHVQDYEAFRSGTGGWKGKT